MEERRFKNSDSITCNLQTVASLTPQGNISATSNIGSLFDEQPSDVPLFYDTRLSELDEYSQHIEKEYELLAERAAIIEDELQAEKREKEELQNLLSIQKKDSEFESTREAYVMDLERELEQERVSKSELIDLKNQCIQWEIKYSEIEKKYNNLNEIYKQNSITTSTASESIVTTLVKEKNALQQTVHQLHNEEAELRAELLKCKASNESALKRASIAENAQHEAQLRLTEAIETKKIFETKSKDQENKISKLHFELESVGKELDGIKEMSELLGGMKDTLVKECEQAVESKRVAESEMSNLRRELGAQKRELTSMESKKEYAERLNDRLKGEIDSLTKELGNITDTLEEFRHTKVSLESKLEDSRADVMRSETKALQAMSDAAEAERKAQAARELDISAAARAYQLERKLLRLEDEQSASSGAMQTLQIESAELRTQLTNTEQQLADMTAECESVRKREEEVLEAKHEVLEVLREYRDESEKKLAKFKEQSTELNNLKSTYKKLKAKYATLETQCLALQREAKNSSIRAKKSEELASDALAELRLAKAYEENQKSVTYEKDTCNDALKLANQVNEKRLKELKLKCNNLEIELGRKSALSAGNSAEASSLRIQLEYELSRNEKLEQLVLKYREKLDHAEERWQQSFRDNMNTNSFYDDIWFNKSKTCGNEISANSYNDNETELGKEYGSSRNQLEKSPSILFASSRLNEIDRSKKNQNLSQKKILKLRNKENSIKGSIVELTEKYPDETLARLKELRKNNIKLAKGGEELMKTLSKPINDRYKDKKLLRLSDRSFESKSSDSFFNWTLSPNNDIYSRSLTVDSSSPRKHNSNNTFQVAKESTKYKTPRTIAPPENAIVKV